MMSNAILINEEQIISDFSKLSNEHKKEAADFVAFLKIKEEAEATNEILSDEHFLKRIMQGDDVFKSGRVKKWAEVKEDV